jgi:hypothetical protein
MSATPDDLGDNSDGDGFTYDDSAVATPFRCDFCKAGFPSTTEMKSGPPFPDKAVHRLTDFILVIIEVSI